jgi:hypothetical protein
MFAHLVRVNPLIDSNVLKWNTIKKRSSKPDGYEWNF